MEKLEQVMASAITWANSQANEPPAGEVLANLMEALHLQKEALTSDYREKVEAKANITIEEVEEGLASATPGAPHGPEDQGPKGLPSGPIPAGPTPSRPSVSTASASTQTPEEWATPMDVVAIATAAPSEQQESLETRWRPIEAQLLTAQKVAAKSRVFEEETCGRLEAFARAYPDASHLWGKWPTRVANRRENWAAWDKCSEDRKARTKAAEELGRARADAERLVQRLAEARRREEEALLQLQGNQPHPDLRRPRQGTTGPPRGDETAGNGDRAATAAGFKPEEEPSGRMKRRCMVCGTPGVRTPSKCPYFRDHAPPGYFGK